MSINSISRNMGLNLFFAISLASLIPSTVLAQPTPAPVAQKVSALLVCADNGDDPPTCYCPNSDAAPANIFLQGLAYTTYASVVCLPKLGNYNSETGAKTSNNFDSSLSAYVLNGKYLKTGLSSLAPTLSRFNMPTNDFRIAPAGTSSSDARRNGLWSAESHLYYYISDYRTTKATDSFFNSLGLNSNLLTNALHRQYRPDLQGIINSRLPITTVSENTAFTPWANNIPANDYTSPEKQRSQVSDPLDSFAFDPDWIVGQYTGAMSNWIAGGTSQWPNNPTWGTISASYDWRTDIRPALVEGFKLWNAYRYTGHTELYQYAQTIQRRWNNYSCGANNQAKCNKGLKIDNSMMYLDTADPVLNNPTNPSWPAGNSDDTLLFPYATNFPSTGVRSGAGLNHFGPTNGTLGGMYIAAIFYDISKEIGLGDYKADQIFWKTISLIDPATPINMTTFGQKIQQAIRALFPSGTPNVSWYEQDIVDVLTSRGIRVNGVANFTDNLPAALGTAANPGPGTLTVSNAPGFGSFIPESQRNSSTGYNFLSYFSNGYTVNTAGTQYVTYQFHKYSNYGPCDSVDFTNGTFNIPASTSNPIMNYDGSMAVTYKNRDLANTIIMSPGNTLTFLRRRQSCVSEEEGYYAEDVRPFGFRAVKAIPNGFTFTVQKIYETGTTKTYRLTIVDPSLTLTGANTGPATYNWAITSFNGTVTNATGQQINYIALKDQPLTISINRVRGQTDNITVRERGNDLDRNSGKQFSKDFWNTGYPVTFDTIVNRRLVEGHGSYNSALNPVGGAFGVQGRRWTTPNQIVKPLNFSTVSHGIGSGSNQNGPYNFDQAVYYNACIWGARANVTNFPGCHSDQANGDYEIQVPFSQVGITLGDPFAIVTAGSYPGYLWTVNYPSSWRLDPNREYHFGSHISASVVSNGYSYQVCSYAQAAWDGATAGNAADRSDWLAGANWSGQSGAPPPQTMRQYLGSSGSVSNCTFSAYRFNGVTVPN